MAKTGATKSIQQEKPPVAIGKPGVLVRLQVVALLLTEHLGRDVHLADRFSEFLRVFDILRDALLLETTHATLDTATGTDALLHGNLRHRHLNDYFAGFDRIAFALVDHHVVFAELFTGVSHVPALRGSIDAGPIHRVIPDTLRRIPFHDKDRAVKVHGLVDDDTPAVGFTLFTDLDLLSLKLVHRLLFLLHVLADVDTALLHVVITFLSFSSLMLLPAGTQLFRCSSSHFSFLFYYTTLFILCQHNRAQKFLSPTKI